MIDENHPELIEEKQEKRTLFVEQTLFINGHMIVEGTPFQVEDCKE